MPRLLPAFTDLPLRAKGLVVVSIPVLSLLIVLAAMVFVQREEQRGGTAGASIPWRSARISSSP